MARKKKSVDSLEPSAEVQQEPVAETGITMDALTEGEAFPEVKENAIEAVAKKQQKEEEKPSEPQKLNLDGTVAKKRGRKPGQKSAFKNPRDKEPEKDGMSSQQAAVAISGIIEGLQVSLISKEFIYHPIERETNQKAWEKTLDHYGGVNLSPPAELALSHIAIISARAMQGQETKTKLSLAGTWFKMKWQNFKNRKSKNGALSDNRENTERKDDLGEEKSESSKS